MGKSDLYISVFIVLVAGCYAGWQRVQPYVQTAKSEYVASRGFASRGFASSNPSRRAPDSSPHRSITGSAQAPDAPPAGAPYSSFRPSLPSQPFRTAYSSDFQRPPIPEIFLLSESELRAARLRYLSLPAQPPVPGMTITSPFGWRIDPVEGELRYHGGIDIPVPEGRPVHAPGGGVITDVGYTQGYGLFVEIRHAGTSYTSRLAHLSGFDPQLSVGQMVRRGDLLAFSGSTGRSTGPHLHFEIRNEDDTVIDPYRVYEEYRHVEALIFPARALLSAPR